MVGEIYDGRLSTRVRERAQALQPGSFFADLLLAPFWFIGWAVFWVLLLAGQAGRVGFAAIQVGWLDARAQAKGRGLAANQWPVRPRQPRKKAAGSGAG